MTICTPGTWRCGCIVSPRRPGCRSPCATPGCPSGRCRVWPRRQDRSGPGASIPARSTRTPRSRFISGRIEGFRPCHHNGIVGFYDRFELIELSRDDGIKTFRARELATGRLVQAHLFVHPAAPESVALLQKLDSLPEEEQRRILDRGDHQGTPYVVTELLADQPGFREWLVAKARKQAPFQTTPKAAFQTEQM